MSKTIPPHKAASKKIPRARAGGKPEPSSISGKPAPVSRGDRDLDAARSAVSRNNAAISNKRFDAATGLHDDGRGGWRRLRPGDLVTHAFSPSLAQVVVVDGDGVVLAPLIDTDSDEAQDTSIRWGLQGYECRIVPTPPLPLPTPGGSTVPAVPGTAEPLASLLQFVAELRNLHRRVVAFEEAGGQFCDAAGDLEDVLFQVYSDIGYRWLPDVLTSPQSDDVVRLVRLLVTTPATPIDAFEVKTKEGSDNA